MMKYSVIIPIHYSTKYNHFETALNSVINQTLLPYEIIIICDGVLEDLINDFINRTCNSSDRIKFLIFRNESNIGPGLSRNIGVNNSTTDYIAFMDADDYSVSNRFELQMNNLFETDIDIIGGQIDEYDENLISLIASRKVPLDNIDIINSMKFRNSINNVTVLMKKKCFQQIGGFPNLYFGEDYILWLNAINAGFKIKNIDITLVKVRTSFQFVEKRLGFNNFKNNIKLLPYLIKNKQVGLFYAIFRVSKIIILLLLPIFIKKHLFYKYNR